MERLPAPLSLFKVLTEVNKIVCSFLLWAVYFVSSHLSSNSHSLPYLFEKEMERRWYFLFSLCQRLKWKWCFRTKEMIHRKGGMKEKENTRHKSGWKVSISKNDTIEWTEEYDVSALMSQCISCSHTQFFFLYNISQYRGLPSPSFLILLKCVCVNKDTFLILAVDSTQFHSISIHNILSKSSF